MKVAVCISGQCVSNNPKTNLTHNNDIIKQHFPNLNFYYATWNSYKNEFEQEFPKYLCRYFEEPNINYHPYLDIPKDKHITKRYQSTLEFMKKDKTGNRLKWSAHHTKQILIHHWLIKDLVDDYDVIVRARFDTFISKNANFDIFIEDTFDNNRVNGFGATKQKKFDILNEFDSSATGTHHYHILDQMIIHRTDMVNFDLVNILHEQKLLHAAETGWYQVLSMPYGPNKHRDHDGWVNHDKNILPEFFY